MNASPITDIRLGTDIVSIPRLTGAYLKFGRGFFERVLREEEIASCDHAQVTRFLDKAAGRIALKEAVSKALGTGMHGFGWQAGLPWKDVEIASRKNAAPTLKLHGKAKARAEELHITDWQLTLAHDGDYATATVLGFVR